MWEINYFVNLKTSSSTFFASAGGRQNQAADHNVAEFRNEAYVLEHPASPGV